MTNSNPYIPFVSRFKNSSEFYYLATKFNKDGRYCDIPEGTPDYIAFWKDVKDKCINGFTNSSGQSITGAHFFYLNFCKILSEYIQNDRKVKKYNFPKFVDLDYEYFWMIEFCKKNEKFLIASKGRRQGWSYKGACQVAYEFTFFRESRCIIGAFLSDYSLGTMKMVKDYLNHISENTPFGHMRTPDKEDYFMSRYEVSLGGLKVWKGYQSSVESITFKDKATAAVGKSASVLLLDEAGVFPNIIQSWSFTEPLLKDGSSFTGVAIVYGSSGEMESGAKYFYEMFINPEQYNFLSFDDPENPTKKIGYFSSATKGRMGICKDPNSKWFKKLMVDEDGNSNEEAAYDDLMWERSIAKMAANPAKYHYKVTQYPVKWEEAFLRNKGTIFASPEMLDWLSELESTPSLRDQGAKGELVFNKENKLEWRPNDELIYITDFPLKKDVDTTGCTYIWEHPESFNGEIPYSLYVAGQDPYDMDKADGGSLGSFFIYKRFIRANSSYDVLVAEYTGRPKYADQFYENCRRLCIYYNAKVLYENNLKGFKNYMIEKNSLHYMWETPINMIRDIIKDSKVQRGYGIHMQRGNNGSSGIKDMAEIYTRDWLYERITDINGKEIFRFHTIKSIPLLKELIMYDGELNTDRVMAFMLCILQTKELHQIHVNNMINSSKELFGNDKFLNKHWIKAKVASQQYNGLKLN